MEAPTHSVGNVNQLHMKLVRANPVWSTGRQLDESRRMKEEGRQKTAEERIAERRQRIQKDLERRRDTSISSTTSGNGRSTNWSSSF